MALSLSIIKIYKNYHLKFLEVLSPEIVNDLFQFRELIPYALRQTSQFQIPFQWYRKP